MKILIATLSEDFPIIEVDRADYTSAQLAYNLDTLWAWNISEIPSDGPAVFVNFK